MSDYNPNRNMDISDRIRDYLKKHNMTQKQFAEIFDVSVNLVEAWLANPESKYYRKLSKMQMMAIESVIGGKDSGICAACGRNFWLSDNQKRKRDEGHQIVCSDFCRAKLGANAASHKRGVKEITEAKCGVCGKVFVPNYQQKYHIRKGKNVVCSIQCRGKVSGRKKKNMPYRSMRQGDIVSGIVDE